MKEIDIDEVFEHHRKLAETLNEFAPDSELALTEEDKKKKKKAKKPRTLNIFEVLKQTDKFNFGYYNELKEDVQKEIEPWVIQRWLANKKLDLVNEITNPLIHVVPKELAWRILCAIGLGKATRYAWDTPPAKSSKAGKVVKVVAEHYNVSTRVAVTYIPNLTKEAIVEMAELQHMEKSDLTKLKKLL